MNDMEKAIYEYSEYLKLFRVKLNEIRDSDILNDYQKQIEEDRLFEQRTLSNERSEFHRQSNIAEGDRQLMKRFGDLFIKYFSHH